MRRDSTQNSIRNRISRLRSAVPEIAIRTTLIVGDPGETEEHFESLKNFIQEIKFDRLGIFTYSEEEGTAAAALEDNVPRQIKDDRKNSLQDVQQDISLEKNELFIGKELKVIIDKSTEKISVGRTEFDSPEIDNIVHVKGKAEVGSFSKVIIQEVNEYELIGEIIKS